MSKNLFDRAALSICASIIAVIGDSGYAQERRLIPTFEAYVTDNVNSGSRNDEIAYNGALISVPSSLQPQKGTVYKLGLVWLNFAYWDTEIGSFGFSPLLGHKSDSPGTTNTGYFGGLLDWRIVKSTREQIRNRTVVSRIIESLHDQEITFIKSQASYQRALSPQQTIKVAASLAHFDYSGVSAQDGVTYEAEFSHRFKNKNIKVQNSVVAGLRERRSNSYSGESFKFSSQISKFVLDNEIYTNFSFEKIKDDAPRPTQLAARSEYVRSIEVGYAVPFPGSQDILATFYGRHETSSSNLSLFESKENRFGLKFKVRF